MPKKIDDAVLFRHLGRTLADDLLRHDAVGEDEVDEILRAAGADPAAIGRRGKEHVARILDARRLAWMRVADEKMHRFEELEEDDADLEGMTEDELRQELRLMQARPDTSAAISAAFSKRAAVKAGADELRGMLRQARRLDRLSKSRRGDDDP